MFSSADNSLAGLAHDPGGKVRIALEDGIEAGALFSACGQYRQVLWRLWSGASLSGFVLWIGMNPSTADGKVDDPTVRKERKFTAKWGFGHYVKCNVMDYRATDPRTLRNPGVVPCSDQNLPAMIALAREASLVVLAFGSPHKSLRVHGDNVVRELRAAGIPLHCLALTKDGLPGHPLYLKDSSELIAFPEAA